MPQKPSLVVSETMLKLLFDRFESSNKRSTEAVVELTDSIVILLKTIGQNPANIVKKLEDIENFMKNLNRDSASIKKTREAVEKANKNMWRFYVVTGVVFSVGMALLFLLINLQQALNILINGM